MVAIKENFCSQCLQRCMDVKTELEKLPKLSKITVGEEVIRMVDLTIPYVKEEFLAQRMSDYIDDIVKGADAYEDERKRVRYIRDCLALKRLFGVMVTDMNAIKLKLYKRERIKEQSRYLRYEEAVGSTDSHRVSTFSSWLRSSIILQVCILMARRVRSLQRRSLLITHLARQRMYISGSRSLPCLQLIMCS